MSTISVIQYYFHLFMAYGAYYLTYGFNMFRGYPLEVQVAVVVTELSAVLIAIMLIALVVLQWKNRVRKRLFQRIKDRYGKGMSYLLSGEALRRMSREDIAEVFDIESKDIGKPLLKNRREKMVFLAIFYMKFVKLRNDQTNKDNIRNALYLFAIPEYLEHEASLGSTEQKVFAVNVVRTLKLPLSPWVINKLLNSKYLRVQRVAMYANIALSSDSDLDYFETDFFDNHCCIKDEIELAYTLQRRRKAGLKLPNLARWANMQKSEQAQCLFVRLMRRFDQHEYCEQLRPLFSQTRKKKLIEENLHI